MDGETVLGIDVLGVARGDAPIEDIESALNESTIVVEIGERADVVDWIDVDLDGVGVDAVYDLAGPLRCAQGARDVAFEGDGCVAVLGDLRRLAQALDKLVSRARLVVAWMGPPGARADYGFQDRSVPSRRRGR